MIASRVGSASQRAGTGNLLMEAIAAAEQLERHDRQRTAGFRRQDEGFEQLGVALAVPLAVGVLRAELLGELAQVGGRQRGGVFLLGGEAELLEHADIPFTPLNLNESQNGLTVNGIPVSKR